MDTAAMAKPLSTAVAVQRASGTPVAAPSSADPPRAGTRAVSGAKPNVDRVSISDAARLQQANGPRESDRITQGQGPRSQADQMMADFKASFFANEGDDNFNAKLDLNRDGVINTTDLGMFKEKMASAGLVPPPPDDEAQAAPTLDSIRDAFFTREGDDGFNAAADLNGDGIVNVRDLAAFKLAQSDTSEPTLPISEPTTGPIDAQVAGVATQSSGVALNAEPDAPTVVSDPAGSTPQAANALAGNTNDDATATASGSFNTDPAGGVPEAATALLNVAAGEATPGVAGASVDAQTTRMNLLDQLREAFFSREGEDRFDASLDGNGDGLINVADFLSVRDRV